MKKGNTFDTKYLQEIKMEFEFLHILGKEDSSEEVRDAIKKFKLLDVRKSSGEIRRGSKKGGLDLIIEKGRVVTIQVYLRPDSPWEAYSGSPPFGIRQGMNQQQVWPAPILGTTLYERVVADLSAPRDVRAAAGTEPSAARRSGRRGTHVAANFAGVW
jgi:hypothetical protein